MSLFNRLTQKVKNYCYKLLIYLRQGYTAVKKTFLVCTLQIIVFYLADLFIIVPETHVSLINIGMLISAIAFPVTFIITSKVPIIKFRIFSNYRHGFNSVYKRLVLFFIMGFTSQILPSIKGFALLQVVPTFINESSHILKFLDRDVFWFKHIFEIEVLFGICFTVLRVIWLGANPVKFHKSKGKNIYRETILLLETKDEATIESLINELIPNLEKIISVANSAPELNCFTIPQTPLHYTYLILQRALDHSIFCQAVVKNHRGFLGVLIAYHLRSLEKKYSKEVYTRLTNFLLKPLVEAFKMNEKWYLQDLLLMISAVDRSISKTTMVNILFEALKTTGIADHLSLNIPLEKISNKDYEKYILIISNILEPNASLEDLKAFTMDLKFIRKLFAALYQENHEELITYVNSIIAEHTIIQIIKNLIRALQNAKIEHAEHQKTVENLSAILIDIVLNNLSVLGKASMHYSKNWYILLYCKALFDEIFKDINLLSSPQKKGGKTILYNLSDRVCRYFLNLRSPTDIQNFLYFVPKEKTVETSQQKYYPLSLYFQVYPLASLRAIFEKEKSSLAGSDQVAIMVFRCISKTLIEANEKNLEEESGNLYLPQHIAYNQIDNKHYLIEMKNEEETKLELFYDF